MNYRMAKEGVFRTVQGEGVLSGLPMLFIRLSGCQEDCAGCDTDYAAYRETSVEAIVGTASTLMGGSLEWAWITGGEPTEQELGPLAGALRSIGLKVALATSGVRPVFRGVEWVGCDFLSVSPHDPAKWVQRSGDQINLVPGLGGLSLSDPMLIDAVESCWRDFEHRYVTPMADKTGKMPPSLLAACRRWVDSRRGWRLGVQAHRAWGMP